MIHGGAGFIVGHDGVSVYDHIDIPVKTFENPPNRTYLITRRCSERRFFLRPDPQITQIFEYLLALACERHGILLHGFVCMSNHYHLVITDRNGRLPSSSSTSTPSSPAL